MKKLITLLGIACILGQTVSSSVYSVYAESFLEETDSQSAQEQETVNTEEATALSEDTVESEELSEKEETEPSTSTQGSEGNESDSRSENDKKNDSTEKTSENNVENILENESVLQSFSAPPTGGPGPGHVLGALRLWDSNGRSFEPTAQAWQSPWLTPSSSSLVYRIGESWDPFNPFKTALLIAGASGVVLNDRRRHIGSLVGLDKAVDPLGWRWAEHRHPLHYRITEFADDDIVNTSTGNSRARFTVRITDENAPHGWIDLYGYVQVRWPDGNNNAIYMGATQGSGGVFLYNPQTRSIEFKRHARNTGTMSSNAAETFYTFSVRRPGSTQSSIENINPIFSFTANGRDTVDGLRSRYNSAAKPTFAYGDVVEVFHTRPTSVGMLSSGIVINQGSVAASDNNRGYLELTSSGYRQLTFNRARPRQVTISTNTTNAQLDASIANSLDMSGATGSQIERFVTYPDRSRIGISNGVIRVRQQLSTGGFVYRDYQVPFDIQGGVFQADIHHQNLLVGQTFDINRSITNVRYNGTVLNSSQYTLGFQLGTVLDVA
ncbi:hypothetical protein D920_00382, partial [Enterococcus faecalis 13-SD-W-01]